MLDRIYKARKGIDAIFLIREHFKVHVAYLLAFYQSGAIDYPCVLTTYPEEWVAEYVNRQYVGSDPVIMNGFARQLPFEWSQMKLDQAGVEFMQAARQFGLGASG